MRLVDIDPVLDELDKKITECEDGSRTQAMFALFNMMLRTLPIIDEKSEFEKVKDWINDHTTSNSLRSVDYESL